MAELRDLADDMFTAMERTTGWHAAIAARMMADGVIGPGVHVL